MKVFIFGAGASKGSQAPNTHDVLIAPVMDELFAPRYDGPATEVELQHVDLEEYRKSIASHESLEAWLTVWWQSINDLPEEYMKVAERASFGRLVFYLWRLLQKVSTSYDEQNGYRKFLKKLRAKHEIFGLINFNYDTLLDKAVQDVFGVNLVNSIECYSKGRYIKPHGSVNWFLQRRQDDPSVGPEKSFDNSARIGIASNSMFNGSPLKLDGVVIVSPTHNDLNGVDFVSSGCFQRQYPYPLLFLPLTLKQYSFVANFYEKVISEGKILIQKAKEIYLIGYRAKDDIIKEMLREAPLGTLLHVVNTNNSANGVMEDVLKWASNLKQGKIHKAGFADFILQY